MCWAAIVFAAALQGSRHVVQVKIQCVVGRGIALRKQQKTLRLPGFRRSPSFQSISEILSATSDTA